MDEVLLGDRAGDDRLLHTFAARSTAIPATPIGLEAVRKFLGTVLAALARNRQFTGHWLAGSPWRDDSEAGG